MGGQEEPFNLPADVNAFTELSRPCLTGTTVKVS